MADAAFRFRPRVERLPGSLRLHEALPRLRARRRVVLLEFAEGATVLGFDPLPADAPETLEGLRGHVRRLSAQGGGDAVPGPFQGGFLGALSYDLGVPGEGLVLPPEPWSQPPVVGGLYTDFLVRDEAADATWLVLGEDPGDGRPSVEARRAELLAALAAEAPWSAPRPLGPLERHVPVAEHRRRIEDVRRRIAAGEIYQANLAHRFTRVVEGDPVDLYARVRDANPGPYLGFLRWEEGALLSASPELLLAFGDPHGRGPEARTRPIKGTIERGATPAEDRRRAQALLASEKDLAELAMIVDLERNDLGRVAAPGGVRVEAFPRLESYASVHHLVADVVARPAPGVDAVRVLASLFPGGSITGAPKLASMEAIAALEGEGRGFSFGSLGFLGLDGAACFNLLIRTLLWRPRPDLGPQAGEVAYRVGGGITWGSDPALEERESLAKGAPLARALEDAGVHPAVPDGTEQDVPAPLLPSPPPFQPTGRRLE